MDIHMITCDQCNNPATLSVRPVTGAWSENGVACYSIGDLRSGCDDHLPELRENETADYWYNKLP